MGGMTTQSDSPVVDEVRRRRGELSRRFDDDLEAFGRHLMEYQRRFQDRLVSQITVVPAPNRDTREQAQSG
jgi:hypothetical protein